jgi:predicted alpha/beta-hydrolase family hydrolase
LERTSRLEELKIPLPEPLGGHDELSGVLGIPEWWPTGSRVAVVLAHSETSDLNDPLIERIQVALTERKFLTLRFNFPFAEGKRRKKPDDAAVLRRAFRAAIAVLGRDPSATPAHLFLGGVGIGAQIAADLAAELLPIDGACLLGFPLHPPSEPHNVKADALYRVVSPMLFIQGTNDPRCNLDSLRRSLSRVGAPTSLYVSKRVGENLRPLESTQEANEAVFDEVFGTLNRWLSKILHEE